MTKDTKPNKQSLIRDVSDLDKMIEKLPFIIDWVKYKGEDVVAQINIEATKKARKPMLDISYCMTKAFNQVILKTVQFDKNKFKKSHLSDAVW